MQQLVRNLVLKAIKYGSPDQPVGVALRGEQADLCLEVTNRGSAIDPSDVRTIFDPLERGALHRESDDARGDTGGGLGLGLFIVREIAKAHGGDVEVHSERKETTFTVRLPRHGGARLPE